MPSGLHGGGGGGSHFGGGASGGGFHSSGGGFNFRGPRTFIFFGHSYYFSSGAMQKLSILLFFVIFSAFFVFFGGISIASAKSDINKIKIDHLYYQDMIETAESNPALLRDGIVVSHFYNENAGKWYFVYKVQKDDFLVGESEWLEGWTYSVYTRDEINAINVGSIIEIAVDSPIVDRNTDSIPTDFKTKTLSDDGEYLAAQKSLSTGIVVLIISSTLTIGLLVGLVWIAIKNAKKEEIEKTEKEQIELNKKNGKVCKYCGRPLGDDVDVCPSCGAPQKKST